MPRQTSLLLIFVILLGGAAYFWYNTTKSPAEPPEESASVAPASLAELRRLKDLKLDTSVFQDQFFKTLEAPPEITGEVKPGRTNPFLPF